jgi:hypothetical protein
MNRCFYYLPVVVGTLTVSQLSYASLPVRFEVVGCVQAGEFISEGHKYPIQSESEKAALKAHEGKTVEISGFLNPGDRLSVGKLVVVASNCKLEAHRSKFL